MSQATIEPRQQSQVSMGVALVALAAFGTFGAEQVQSASGEPPELAGFQGAQAVCTEQQRPLPHPDTTKRMTPAVRLSLERGFAVAVTLVRESPRCAALFERLDADAEDSLSRTIYIAVPYEDKARCERRNALALTRHGSPLVKLCPAFARLGGHDAALALIHEALHFAGLPEWPPTPGAMTAQQIQAMVESACAVGSKTPQAAHPAGVLLAATSTDPDH